MTLTGVDAARTAGRSRQKAKDDRRVWHGRGWVLSPENSPLAEQILVLGGALISEFPPGTFAVPQNFPIRNRILRGMSIGVLVRRSRRITPVRALPLVAGGNSRGANTGIKQGAKLVATWKGGGGGPCKRATTCFGSARLPESAEACAASLFPDEGSLPMKSEFWGLLKADASTPLDESVERLEKTSCRLPKSSPPCSNWSWPAKSSRCRGRIL